MQRSEIKWLGDNEVAIAGVVDEYTDFSVFAPWANKKLVVNFGAVTRINCSGIRNWIQTIMKHRIELVLRDCSSAVVDQLSMIPEFIGRNGHIESFYVHFCCPGCAAEERKLCRNEASMNLTEFFKNELEPERLCDCGEVMELDHNPDIYFAFFRFAKSA